MTLWHKRLIIFLAKIAGIIIGIIVISLFLYYYFYFTKDNLIKYVPQDAILYSTFRVDKELLENQLVNKWLVQLKQDYNLSNLNLKELNYMVGYNLAFAVLPNNQTNKLNFDYLLIIDLNKRPANLEQQFNFIKQYNLKYNLLNNKNLEKNILLVSNSQEVLDQVININNYQANSLAKKTEVLRGLDSLEIENNGRIYLNSSALSDYIYQIPELPLKLSFASLSSDKLSQVYLGVRFNDNNLIIKNFKADNESYDQADTIFSLVPDTTIFSLAFNNGTASWQKLLNILKELDLNSFLAIEKNLAYWQNMYNFNLRADIFPLFTDWAQLMITNDYKYILEIKTENNDFNKIEESLKLYLATSNPVEKIKQLPDYSYITQNVRQPENYQFQTQEINGISLHYLGYGANIGYFLQDNKLILSNSLDKLNDLIKQNKIISLKQKTNCILPNNHNGEGLYISSDFLANFSKYFNNLLIYNNILDNSEIWLCLD